MCDVEIHTVTHTRTHARTHTHTHTHIHSCLPSPLPLPSPQVESNFHIPRAAQNWIIGPKLVKSTADLQRTLRDYEITGAAGKARVYLYVMHVKKANVPKEDVEYIRQRQRNIMSQQQPPPQQMAQPGGMGQMGVERGMAPHRMQPHDQQPYMAEGEVYMYSLCHSNITYKNVACIPGFNRQVVQMTCIVIVLWDLRGIPFAFDGHFRCYDYDSLCVDFGCICSCTCNHYYRCAPIGTVVCTFSGSTIVSR